ncbi:MAG: hypothetical protein EHM79_00235 [Geobacter sp.]|nr:MAG: hypothetical protein EHM79_00235 [Geobacter sp.]
MNSGDVVAFCDQEIKKSQVEIHSLLQTPDLTFDIRLRIDREQGKLIAYESVRDFVAIGFREHNVHPKLVEACEVALHTLQDIGATDPDHALAAINLIRTALALLEPTKGGDVSETK